MVATAIASPNANPLPSTAKMRMYPTSQISSTRTCACPPSRLIITQVEEASLDKRVALHPKVFSATTAFHCLTRKEKMLGTVCHFDRMPVRVTEEVATALDDLAPLISEAAFSAIP
jgi:hypothetical protein